jgi:hypothetical protein
MTVKGVPELAGGLDHMVTFLGDMVTAHRAAARIALEAARARTPVATGKLRASGTTEATGLAGRVIFTAPYAGPVHWGVPSKNIPPSLFAIRGAEASQRQWLDVYQDAIQTELNKIEGA